MTHTEAMALSSTASTPSSATSSTASSTTSSPKSTPSTSTTPPTLPFSTALYQQTKARVKQLADEDKSSRLHTHQQHIQQLQADHARVVADYEAKLADERDKRSRERRSQAQAADKLKLHYQQQLDAKQAERKERDDKHEQITKRRQREIEERARAVTLAQYADEQATVQRQQAALTERIGQLEEDVRMMVAEREEEKKRWRAEEGRMQLQLQAGAKLAKEWERKHKAECKAKEDALERIEQLQSLLQQKEDEKRDDDNHNNQQAAIQHHLTQQWQADKEALLNRLTTTTRQAEEATTQLKHQHTERAAEQRRWEEERLQWRAQREEELGVIEERVKEVLARKERAVVDARDECRRWRERVAAMEEEWQRHAVELNGL